MLALGDLLRELLSGRGSAGADVDIDLQRGLEVTEEPMDSMPAELIDVFRKR